jgi:hypothetical protein
LQPQTTLDLTKLQGFACTICEPDILGGGGAFAVKPVPIIRILERKTTRLKLKIRKRV